MASIKNFQDSRKKHSTGVNIFEKGNNTRKVKPKSEKLMDGIGVWTSFYRANPQRFVRDYLGIELKLFQQILLYAMMHFHYLTYIAARGQGKTYLTAIFCVTRAILYPESKIVAAAGFKSQSREVIQKIADMRNKSPLLEREISVLKTSINDSVVEFHNGSWIRTVASNDGARGGRSNVLIIDEFRMVDIDVINTVLRKFQTAERQPKYLEKPEYAHLEERNKEIYLSSAYMKNHHAYERVESYTENMIAGESYFVCSLPYQISIKEGLLNKNQVKDEMSEKTFSELSWYMEMDSLFFGGASNSYFSFDEIDKNRRLSKAYYPKEIVDLLGDKKLAIPKRETGELRVLSADIATMGGAKNDASVYTVARLYPTTDGYERHIIYMETLEGAHTTTQSMRLRQLMNDFDIDTLVLDTLNAGIGVYDQLTQHATDPERGTEYQPLSCMNDERLAERCVHPNAPKVIYSIRATGALNSSIASNFKDSLRTGRIKLLVDITADDVLRSVKGYNKLDAEYKMILKMPFHHTSMMINEILNLESEINDQTKAIRLKEVGGMRKDRYSSISYLDYYVSEEISIKNRRPKNNIVPKKMFKFRVGKLF